jgi:hypothetical protein
MFRFNHHHQGACYLSFAKVTVATVACRNIFNVNFNISFKAKLLCISYLLTYLLHGTESFLRS